MLTVSSGSLSSSADLLAIEKIDYARGSTQDLLFVYQSYTFLTAFYKVSAYGSLAKGLYVGLPVVLIMILSLALPYYLFRPQT